MVYFIWALVGILSFAKKESKAAALVVLAFIACIFCFNTDNADLPSYQTAYLQISSGEDIPLEPVFVLLNRACASLGLSYDAFRAVEVLIGLGCITSTVFRFSPYPACVLFLYSIYPMTLDVTQIRFFMGYCIVCFAIQFLVDYQINKNLKDVLMFFLFIAVATGIHYASILYAILGILFLDVRKHKTLLLLCIPVGVVMFFIFLNQFLPLIEPVIGSRKTEAWVARGKSTRLRNILWVTVGRGLPMMLSIFVSFLIRRKQYAHIVGGNKNSLGVTSTGAPQRFITKNGKVKYYDLRVNQCLFMCLLYTFLFTMLELVVSSQYERLGRLALLVGAVLLTRQIFYLSSFNKMSAQILTVITYVLCFSAMMFHARAGKDIFFIDHVFRRVMENNSLFGLLQP